LGGGLMLIAMLIVEWPNSKTKSPLTQTHFT
jgi:hypothetical protein